MAGSLLPLRDCCQRLKLPREALLHTLELACLPHKQAPQEVSSAAAAALAGMLSGAGDQLASILKGGGGAPQAPAAQAGADGQQQQQQQSGSPGVLRYTVQHLDPGQAARLAGTPREDGTKVNMADVLLQ